MISLFPRVSFEIIFKLFYLQLPQSFEGMSRRWDGSTQKTQNQIKLT